MKHVYKMLYVIVGVSIIVYFISSLYFYYQEKPEVGAVLQDLPVVHKQTRLLVIAPHCDDETLGCAGVIHDVIAAGGQVMVVFMTNGDGFTVATEEQFHRLFLTNEDYVNSGYARQKEALHALHLLGVPEKQIVFLGFPDRGLRAIWSDYWDKGQPYQSRYTGSEHSPYTTSYQQNAPYTGETVLNNLEQIMRTFQPNLILAPHPADEHPDHASTWAFVAAAFMKLSWGKLEPGVNLYTYLIHRGDFPIPHGYKTDALLSPPKPLYQTQPSSWLQYSIGSDMEILKEQSMKEYISQIRVPIMSSLLYSFIRKNELFEEVHFPLITEIPLDVDLRNLEDWSNQEPILVNPRGVNLVGALEPKGKITNIYSCMQDNTIWMRFHIPGFSKKRNQYNVSIVTFSRTDNQMSREKQTVYFSKTNTNLPSDDIVRYPDDVIIQISSPSTQLRDFLFIRVETKNQFGIMFNHTVWQPAFLRRF